MMDVECFVVLKECSLIGSTKSIPSLHHLALTSMNTHYSVSHPGHHVSFLDIKFWFDQDGNLQIDLFIKETDARSYLFFGSFHPNHVYSGIVYSQALRLRRIINNQERLVKQLDILHDCFKDCNYPAKMHLACT